MTPGSMAPPRVDGTTGVSGTAADVVGLTVSMCAASRCWCATGARPTAPRPGAGRRMVPWPERAVRGQRGHRATGAVAVHAPPGTGVAKVFGDLVAAAITERPAACRAAQPGGRVRGVARLVHAPGRRAQPGADRPRDRAGGTGAERADRAWPAADRGGVARAATAIDYFASTARLSDGVGAWAMLAARLGDGAANRAFAERWWRGAIRGTDVCSRRASRWPPRCGG